jgi:hypothetical protein
LGGSEDEEPPGPDAEGLEEPPGEPEPEVPTTSGDEDRLEALGEPPEEVPVDLYTDSPEEDEDADEDTDDEIQDVCPKCGELAWDEQSGDCLSCISDEVMTFAVNEAKAAHKDGADISGLTGDLKSAKQARQEKDYAQVVSISEHIIGQLEEILGRDLQSDLAERRTGKRKKKKKKRTA